MIWKGKKSRFKQIYFHYQMERYLYGILATLNLWHTSQDFRHEKNLFKTKGQFI